MFLVERNGSNPFSLSALENTLFSVQIVFRRKMVVGVEVVEILPKVCLTCAGSEERSFVFVRTENVCTVLEICSIYCTELI